MTELRATRDGYGEALLALGGEDPRIVVVDADLFRSTRTAFFAEAYPDRFFEIGIAEQDMVSTAVGLAVSGMVAFANSFAVFLTGRAFDQTRQQIALPAVNVKLVGSSAGITQGPDGATHQSVVDVALMRSLPNMSVVVPSDAEEAKLATRAAARYDGPVYMRMSRYETPIWRADGAPFEMGKAEVRREGADVSLIACGVILGRVMEAADALGEDGISAEVLNVHTIKPLDAEGVLTSCQKTGAAVTVEEHNIIGGLGSAVAELLAERAGKHIPLRRVGVADTFGESGLADELLEKHGLTAANIAATARAALDACS